MDGVVNLRQMRKRKARQDAAKTAAANRAKSGQSRAARQADARLHAMEERRLNWHLREDLRAGEGES